jgi:YVTN family beta-propeller protein
MVVMIIARVLLISAIVGGLGVAVRAEAGGKVYTANMESGTISVIDPDAMKVVSTIDPRGHRIRDLSLSPDQSKLFAANMHSGTLAVVAVVSDGVIGTIPTGRMPNSVAVTPDGKQVWVVNGAEEYVTVVDVALLKVVGRVSLGETVGPGCVRFSPDGARAYVSSPARGTLSVIDVSSKRVIATAEVGARPTFIQVTSDGRRIWGTDSGGDEIYAFDGQRNALVGKLSVGKAPSHLAIVGDTLYVTVAGTNEVAVVADADGKVSVKGRIKVGGRPGGIRPSPDGKRLYVTAEGTNDLHVIDVALQRVIGTVPVGRRPVAVVTAR